MHGFKQELLDHVRTAFHIGEDQAPGGGVDGTTKEMLTLHHAGADLEDDWVLNDLGLPPGINSFKSTLETQKT